jgi:hypothetical protein
MFRLTTNIIARYRLPFNSSGHLATYSTARQGAPQKVVFTFPVKLIDAKQPFVPADWVFIEASPGGLDLHFYNKKTHEVTMYTPKGMVAEELIQIPGAGKYFYSKENAAEYIKRIAAERQTDAEAGLLDPEVCAFMARI